MAILKMEKIGVTIHRDALTECAKIIQDAGVLELTEVSEKDKLNKLEKKNFQINYVSSRLDLAVSFLSKYEKKSFLRSVFEGGSIEMTEEKIKKLVNTFYYHDIINSVSGLAEKINKNEGKLLELTREKEILKPWANLNIPLSEPRETQYTKTVFLSGEKDCLETAHKEIDIRKDSAASRTSKDTMVLSYLKDSEEELSVLIRSYGLNSVELPFRRGTPAEEIERMDRAESKTLKRSERLHSEAKRLSSHLPELRIISDYIRWRRDRYDLKHEGYGTETTLILEGWCPSESIPLLKERLEKATKLFSLRTIPTDEEPPTCIKNSYAMRPFEPITYLYGVPTAKDIDPTPYLAGFFFLFFGFCLSDVGYGIVLTTFTATILLRYAVPKDMALFLKLFMISGVASFLGGLIFGGYMGIDMSLLPEWLQKMNLLNPLENPLPIFALALMLGIVQILTGMVLAIIREARNGSFSEGLLSKGPWLSLFISIGFWLGSSLGYLPGENDAVWLWMVYASVLAIVLTGGRKYKNPFAKVAMGLTSLYESVNYLSDILSYSRLLAIGLATGALAFSINLLAMMAYEGIPYVGWLVLVLIFVIGHFFNLAVNLLGAFIHTARLQFVEFFGKFIIGTGRAFTPFSRKCRYVLMRDGSLK